VASSVAQDWGMHKNICITVPDSSGYVEHYK
jgi:hypothetical protein